MMNHRIFRQLPLGVQSKHEKKTEKSIQIPNNQYQWQSVTPKSAAFPLFLHVELIQLDFRDSNGILVAPRHWVLKRGRHF